MSGNDVALVFVLPGAVALAIVTGVIAWLRLRRRGSDSNKLPKAPDKHDEPPL